MEPIEEHGLASEAPTPTAAVAEPEVVQFPVHVQIPDLDSAESPDAFEEVPADSEGRLMSQKTSNILIVGGGILVALAAVLPFTAHANRPITTPGSMAAPHDASMLAGQKAAVIGSAAAPSSNAPDATPNITVVLPSNGPDESAPPAVSSNRPMTIADAAIDPHAAAAAHAGLPGAAGSAPQFQTAYRAEVAGRGRDMVRNAYRADNRAGFGNVGPGAAFPGTVQGNPLMPAPDGSPQPPQASQQPTGPQPGVAQFEGIIEKPPIRTNYDDAGQSVH
ncbi:MAG: hypothetical protein ABSG68_04685 [Thermoguttaceae bacterium]|jgi:hypothetical protein